MPTVDLFPSSTVSNNWNGINPGYATAHGALASSSDSGISTPDQNDSCVVELDNLPFASGTINSVQFKTLGFVFLTRSASFDIAVNLLDSINNWYTENVTIAFNGYTPTAANGTVRTTSNGSSAWTIAQVNALRLEITTAPVDPPAVSQAVVTYAYVTVDYTAAAGYGNTVNGVAAANIGKLITQPTANISKVNGI
jgi:hypothetical protein